MTLKLACYLLLLPLVMWTLQSLNINHLFKKNHINQIKAFYILSTLIITYLLVNTVFDIYSFTQLID